MVVQVVEQVVVMETHLEQILEKKDPEEMVLEQDLDKVGQDSSIDLRAMFD